MAPRCVVLQMLAVSFVTLMPWSDASASPLPDVKDWCDNIPGLNAAQVQTCYSATGLRGALSMGLLKAVETCENEFKDDRWNCSMLGNDSLLHRAPEGTREAAFSTALIAAGLAHHISTACQQGSSANCCGGSKTSCSTNHTSAFAHAFALNFITASSTDARLSLVNQHNANAGLRALNKSTLCPAGDNCSRLERVASSLRRKYSRAQRVRVVSSTLRVKNHPGKTPKRGGLVYSNVSPDYCTRNEQAGIAGTQGRECAPGGPGRAAGSDCSLLCCKRGYHRGAYNVTVPCKASFMLVNNQFTVITKTCSKVVKGKFCN